MSDYDYIIIGSGSGGGFAALRLSEDPNVRVLILEAGLSDAHWTTRIPAGARYTFDGGPRTWSFETEPEPHMIHRRLMQPRGKVVGGSSSLNGMVYVRGHRKDFDGWAADGATGWAYEDVLPHFQAIETYAERSDAIRGGDGPVKVHKNNILHPIEAAFLEASAQAGHPIPEDYNGADQLGATAFDSNIDDGWRSGTARACVNPAAIRPNVTLETQAIVTRLLFDHRRVVGVAYRQKGKDHIVRTEGEIIIAAGAFQTPQILMLSGLGPATHLRQHGLDVLVDLPGVGENLQDHLEVHLKHQSPHKGISQNHLLHRHRIILAGIQWYLFKSGPAARAPSRVGGFFQSATDARHPDIQFHFWPYFLEGWSPPPDKDGYCFDVGPVRSESRGWVRLRSADPFDTPLIQLNGLSTDEDMRLFRRAIAIAREIAAQPAFDFCRGPEVAPGADVTSDADLDAYVRANANSAYHPCGTAKMGADELAVVDVEGRIHGVDGLRIADASIMPTITNGNINAPVMMIGEKIAAHILGRA
ncbi:MAG: choline dehydrogenase [Boseongicola sp.]